MQVLSVGEAARKISDFDGIAGRHGTRKTTAQAPAGKIVYIPSTVIRKTLVA
jgi:hypothetical protein